MSSPGVWSALADRLIWGAYTCASESWCEKGRMTATGQCARCRTLRLTEPRSRPRKPPRPRLPTTTSSAPAGGVDEDVGGAALEHLGPHVDVRVLLGPAGDGRRRDAVLLDLEVVPGFGEGTHGDTAGVDGGVPGVQHGQAEATLGRLLERIPGCFGRQVRAVDAHEHPPVRAVPGGDLPHHDHGAGRVCRELHGR